LVNTSTNSFPCHVAHPGRGGAVEGPQVVQQPGVLLAADGVVGVRRQHDVVHGPAVAGAEQSVSVPVLCTQPQVRNWAPSTHTCFTIQCSIQMP